jgi:hypothetical protein
LTQYAVAGPCWRQARLATTAKWQAARRSSGATSPELPSAGRTTTLGAPWISAWT